MLPSHPNGSLIATTSTEVPSYALAPTTDEELEELPLYADDDDRLLLHLRYYARHFIPIFCCVGIIGNCMALMLIRLAYPVLA